MRFQGQHIIDLSKLADNFSELKKIAPNPEICFMVKANAYGHGLLPMVEFSYYQAGIKEFGLATLGEAIHIRQALPDMKCELYVFSDIGLFGKGPWDAYLNRRILPVLSRMDQLDYILKNEQFKNFPLVLKFDTGMHRLGLDPSDQSLDELIKKLKTYGRKTLYHVMSHLSCSSLSMAKNKRNLLQLSEFEKIKDYLKSSGIEIERTSIANSGAIEQGAGINETHIRPGLMLYGPSSLIDKHIDLSSWNRPNISKLTTSVIHATFVKRGTPVGYGATPISASGLMTIIAMGYGDGLRTTYQNSTVYCAGHAGKIVGRVNMDMAQVLFDMDAANEIKTGSEVTIFDHDSKRFREFCTSVKSIPYEVFLSITGRIPKSYHMES